MGIKIFFLKQFQRLFSAATLGRLGTVFLRIAYLCSPRMRKILNTNLKLCNFLYLKKKVIRHCGFMVGTYAALPKAIEFFDFNIQGKDILKTLDHSKPALFFSAHIGQIWLAAVALHLCKVSFYHSYRKLKDGDLNQYLLSMYHQSSPFFLGGLAEQDPKGFLKALHGGSNIIILADQHNHGVFVPFLGKEAKIGTGIAKLALRFRCPLIPIHGILTSKSSYTIEIEPPLSLPTSGSKEDQIKIVTQAIAKTCERWILKTPEQYWWLIKRWPRQYYDQ